MTSTRMMDRREKIVPETLFNLCIQLVAKNLDLVESFHGFPSLVGEKIFRSAVNTERFKDSSYESLSLKLFTEEYRMEVLSTLNVSGQYLGFNYYIENILLFGDLVELDVSYCGMGDDHEMLTHISTMTSLQKLVLSHNALSDSGIQKLTTPYRMFRKGPEHLLHLDLTGNSVSLRCLKFLTSFKELHTVLLPIQTADVKQNANHWCLKNTDYRCTEIATRGWAACVIDKWLENAATRKKREKKSRTGNFYCRSTLMSVNQEKNTKEKPTKPPSVCLLATQVSSNQLFLAKNKRKFGTTGDFEEHCDQETENAFDTSRLLSLYSEESKVMTANHAKRRNKSDQTRELKQLSDCTKLNEMDTELLRHYKIDSVVKRETCKNEMNLHSKLLSRLNRNDQTSDSLCNAENNIRTELDVKQQSNHNVFLKFKGGKEKKLQDPSVYFNPKKRQKFNL